VVREQLLTDKIRDELRALGRYMIDNQLVWGSSGNISARVGEDSFLITASGAWLADLGPEDLVACRISGSQVMGERKPSKEFPLHQAIYALRPEINAVIHSSPFYGTLISCTEASICSNWFVESMYYLERVGRVGYHHPGSAELVEGIKGEIMGANVLILENHGVLVYDTSIQEARMALHTLEVMCRMMVVSRSAGLEIQGLPEETVRDFLSNSGYRPLRRWPDDRCGSR
jgi:ribulose-5-phosphate 4-epimerase/fuculose-1-phosphate aldolase